MNVLCLSAYEATSHRMWRDGLTRSLPDWNWTQLALPARHFAWRRRSNPLTWWGGYEAELSQSYDIVLATSMVDSATLRGLFPNLAGSTWFVYFHENQFAYPTHNDRKVAPDMLIQDVYSALCADVVIFNSKFNHDSFLHGLRRFRKQMPDGFPAHVVETVAGKSEIIPVGIDSLWYDSSTTSRVKNRVLWNHRWEWDKNPDAFVAIVDELRSRDVEFELAIAGRSFRNVPKAFRQLETYPEVVHFGTLQDRGAYVELVRSCGVVISTAIHDFQGLSVLEAMTSGCVPFVPDRMAYPEYVPSRFRYNPDDSVSDTAAHLASLLQSDASDVDLDRFRWERIAAQYRSLLS